MNKILLLTLLLLSTAMVTAQQYPLVTLQDIQFVADTTTDPPSPLNGDTVQVSGCVLVSPLVDPGTDRRPIIWAGAQWVTYIEDSAGHIYGGLNILQDDTSETTGQQTFFDQIDTAQIVTFTGVVTEYYTSTELVELVTPTSPVVISGSMPKRPDPIVLQVSDFDNNGVYNFASEKYENMYVEIRNVLTSNRNTSSGTFNFHDAAGNTMHMWDQSGYFTLRSYRLTGLTNYDPPQNGTILSYIRGIINTRTNGYYIVPIYPGDIGPPNQLPPSITTIRRDAAVIIPDQAVEVSAKIKDLDGTVQESRLYLRVDGGQRLILPMTFNATDTTYRATIPGIISDSSIVDFYIWAKDNDNNVSINPIDTVHDNYFYLVLNRPVGICDVQYSPFGSGYSSYNGYQVTVTGVVTADTSDIEGNETGTQSSPQVYIQNGQGPWSGIKISGTEVYNFSRGDNITVTGIVEESNSVTQISGINNPSNVVLISTGNTLPDAELLSTSEIGLLSSGVVEAEKWEGVLINYQNLLVIDENADGNPGPDQGSGGNRNFGDIIVSDAGGSGTRVDLQDGTHQYHNFWFPGQDTIPIYVRQNSTFQSVRGILWFSFGNYKLIPRKDDDFFGYAPNVFPLSLYVSDGWNMVSVPGIHPAGMDVTNWWANLTGTVFKFVPGSGYSGITTTVPGEGYWMKNAGTETYIYPAIQFVTHDPISASAGWNMFGSYEDLVTVTTLTTTPPGQIVYPIYRYVPGTGYATATYLTPCYGYWVKVLSDCQINIPDIPINGTRRIADFVHDDLPCGQVNWGKITVTDEAGNSYALYAVKGDFPNGGARVDLNIYELPPLPPAGVFDVRYSSGRIAEDINSSVQSIDLRGVTYPVKVRVEGMDIRLQDAMGKVINTNIKSGEEIIINNPEIKKLMVSGQLIPIKFALEQNFPNPFNPVTTIKYQIPKSEKVTIEVYNILGERVKTLVNELLEPGRYEVNWHSNNDYNNQVTSGVYIYRMRAGDFNSVKKMIVLK